MQELKIDLGARSYPIVIGDGLLSRSDLFTRHVAGDAVAVVTNATIAPLYLKAVLAALSSKRVAEVILPDGEEFKTLATVERILDSLVAARMNRDGTVIALGGGVVGDMAGFAAACYQRGIALIQAPTTLLAQVDSSVGGKTGVNHPAGKNLIGAFHQPVAVIADTATLRTLPDRELRAGLAEVIKHGMLGDADFFAWLESHVEQLIARDAAALAHAIRRSCEIKARLVAADERESSVRAHLNLGHTFGHAIEAATAYAGWLHGEAVAAGLLMAGDMSRRLGWLPSTDFDRVQALLLRAGLARAAPAIGAARALDYMRMDKKVRDDKIRLVLLRPLGTAVVAADYPPATLQAVLTHYFGAA
ncbi:MAG TPA: 3-dehydroquinate synthase [Steroidobacteraceae bacterium]|nr:3-dehydroquinate synthase [Steroidobacteraceae bacterium]